MRKLLFTLVFSFIFFSFTFIGCDQITLPELNDPNKEIWFAPNLRSADYLKLFEQSDSWPVARGKVDVFKFYIQQINGHFDGEANFENLRRVKAFELLRNWGIRIAFEAGAIKEYSCQQPLISPTARAVERVKPDYISIDEAHFAANRCGISLVTASNLILDYINYFSSMGVKVGLIEPYPSFDVEYLISVVQSLDNLDHFHVDLDFNAVKERDMEKDRVVNDMNRLSAVCKEKGVKFGIIFTGSPLANDDFSFISTLASYTSYSKYIDLDQEIFQSWQLDLPKNLPENKPFTFTWFIKSLP